MIVCDLTIAMLARIMNLTTGGTASWLDHSRDLLHLVNLKRDEMPRPIIGVGHSFGGAQLYVSQCRVR